MSTAINYERFYLSGEGGVMFPNEAVVRIFRGRYPNLDLRSRLTAGQTVCDVGCGDGRNLLALAGMELELTGVEVTDEIARSAVRKLQRHGLEADIRAGSNAAIPFERLDLLLSWNSAYYLGDGDAETFSGYVEEFGRVVKPGGSLVLSVPMADAFIFAEASEVSPGVVRIDKDPYGVREGERMRIFRSPEEIVDTFRPFGDFRFATIKDDFFGQLNHWWLAVATRR